MFVEVAHPTFDFIQPRALKALGVHPLLGVSEQREVLVNGIGHGRTTRDDVGVIKAFALRSVGLTGVFGTLLLADHRCFRGGELLRRGESAQKKVCRGSTGWGRWHGGGAAVAITSRAGR